MKNPMGNMGNLLKQAQAMQAQMAKVQEETSSKTVTGTAGGGSVTVTATGAMELVGIVIDPEVVKSGDVEMVQDLVLAASNDALRKAREMMAGAMKSVTGGMNVPECSSRMLKKFQHRSRIAQRLNVPKQRLASSLAAALLDGLFEHPAWHYPIALEVGTIEFSPCRNSFSTDSSSGQLRYGS